MRKKTFQRTALLIAAILLTLLIPFSRAGSTQTVTVTEAPPEAEDEPALHTPPVIEDHRASDITKTIAILETSGTLDCSQPGLSGERGCHQYLPSTWRSYSIDVYGYVAEQTPAAAEYVTLTKVQRWLDQGLTARQIFLIWNQGHPGQCKAGVNKHGVPYDSCGYADRALAKLAEVSTARLDEVAATE